MESVNAKNALPENETPGSLYAQLHTEQRKKTRQISKQLTRRRRLG